MTSFNALNKILKSYYVRNEIVRSICGDLQLCIFDADETETYTFLVVSNEDEGVEIVSELYDTLVEALDRMSEFLKSEYGY